MDCIFEVINFWSTEYNPQYIVFKDQFVLCWSGWKGLNFYSEVDIHIINDGVRLFFTANTDVKIEIHEDVFSIEENVYLGYDEKSFYVPFEVTFIRFDDIGSYSITKEYVFEPPVFPRDEMLDLYKRCKGEEHDVLANDKDDNSVPFNEGIALYFFVCYLNGIHEAREDFLRSRQYVDGASGQWYASCKRILDEMEAHNIHLYSGGK